MSRVSYVMMNPGGDSELTACVRARARRARRRAARGRPAHLRDEVLDVVIVGNPIMHHIVLGIDPTPLGQAPVHAGHDRAGRTPRERPRPDLPNGRASTSARASPATSAPTRGRDAGRGPAPRRAHAAARRRRHQRRDRARRPRPAVRGVEPDRTGVRGRADQLRPAGDGRRDRARAHRPDHARAAAQGDRLSTLWSDDPAFAAGRRGLAITGVCGSGIIDVIAEMYPRRRHRRRRGRQGDSPARSTRTSSPTAARSATSCAATPTVRAVRSPRTTCARSNSPRRRCAPASTCWSSTPVVRRVDRHPPRRRVRRPHRPAARDGARPRARLPARRRALGRQRRRRRRRAGAAVARGCGARWSAPCATSIKIETATEPRFQELFVAAMAFPHATAPTANLGAARQLPARVEPHPPTPTGRGRRRRRQESRR